MAIRDAVRDSLDGLADKVEPSARAAADLFAVVDLLDAQPPLRRSLSDPSAEADARVALAERLLAGRIGDGSMAVVVALVGAPGLTGRRLAEALERQGVRMLLRLALASGDLETVQTQLHAFTSTVEDDAALGDVLRNPAYPLAAKRSLIEKLTAGRVHPVTGQLLARAAAARLRTLPLTVASYTAIAADLAGATIARVRVARPLDAARLQRLRAALEASVGGRVAIQVDVDPAVLGGMDVRIGDHIFESTVAGRLEQARRLLNTV